MAGPTPRPPGEPTLSIFPDQVHIGDSFIDADTEGAANVWEVVSRPVTFKKGHEVRARVQRPGEPGTAREKYWAAHEKITVRRGTAASTRPTPQLDHDVSDDVEALRKELRRLRGEVLRLEDDKRELEKRIAHFQREVEQLRAQVPRGMSTS
jgi:hypothetical protein